MTIGRVVVSLLLCAAPAMAQAPAADAGNAQVRALEQLERRWLAHENDPAALETILASDFVHVLPMGFISKRQQIDYLRAHPTPPHASARFDTLIVRVYGGAGVANGVVAATDATGRLTRTAFTDVFAERDGRWRAVSAQELPLAPPASAASAVPPALARDIAAGNQDWIDGLTSGDAARAARAYAPDAVFCSAAGACITGSAAVARHYADVLRSLGRVAGASVHSEALRVDGDLAYESGSAELRLANGRVSGGRYSTVWKRQPDGHWRIFRNLSL